MSDREKFEKTFKRLLDNSVYGSKVKESKMSKYFDGYKLSGYEDSPTTYIFDEKDKQIAELKQQLHDLPKKIVEEIKKELYSCGKTYLEDEPYIEICIVQGILDTILKK